MHVLNRVGQAAISLILHVSAATARAKRGKTTEVGLWLTSEGALRYAITAAPSATASSYTGGTKHISRVQP